MLFNSFGFILVFLPITFALYFLLNHLRRVTLARLCLVLASAVFYAWWNVLYLPLIIGSIAVNYLVGKRLIGAQGERTRGRRLLLGTGILANLGALAYFKYADFFITTVNEVVGSNWPMLELALPLAISFYTFQQLAFIVDCYQGKVKRVRLIDYSVFVLFFPQLIAGPIVHHAEMMPQFASLRNKLINHRNIATGIFLFAIGLFKKVVVADSFAVWATNGFDAPAQLNMLEAWATSLSYTLQLYFDFSGYSDMAIGLALMFNIRLPYNFFSPYKSRSIQDFWRRWHMTLSRFMKDYIYIPLGGNRGGSARTYTNLMLTFALGGLWHGAGWTFVLWGLLHGLALALHRYWGRLGLRMSPWLAWFITFNFINLGWVLFRAEDLGGAADLLAAMAGMGVPLADAAGPAGLLAGIEMGVLGLLALAGGLLVCLLARNSMELMESFRPTWQRALATVALLVCSFFGLNRYSEFLYFQF
jgi:D-alanyl-lipoteichoic acid acyltransferase DltB (MBOAT superfamily)